jgi:hypothetical protein
MNHQFYFDLSLDKPTRWTAQRKAAVILAIRNNVINIWDACERYDLSAEEIAQWERDLDRYGVAGLQIKHINHKTSNLK